MDSSLEPEVLGQACNEIPNQYLDAAKARNQLGWQPLSTLEEGLSRTIQWYTNYLQNESARDRLRVVPAAKSA